MTNINTTVFEHGLTDHVRSCLHFEYLMKGARLYAKSQSEWDHKICLDLIINMLDLLDRPDLRARFSQELHRYLITLKRYADNPNIEHNVLNTVMAKVEHAQTTLHKAGGKFVRELRENTFIQSFMKHHKQPGGLLPDNSLELNYWLQLGTQERLDYLQSWLGKFAHIDEVTSLLLEITRQSKITEKQTAKAGYFHKILAPNHSLQLVKISIKHNMDVYPKISVGRHGISIRFLEVDGFESNNKTQKDIDFELTCCTF